MSYPAGFFSVFFVCVYFAENAAKKKEMKSFRDFFGNSFEEGI